MITLKIVLIILIGLFVLSFGFHIGCEILLSKMDKEVKENERIKYPYK